LTAYGGETIDDDETEEEDEEEEEEVLRAGVDESWNCFLSECRLTCSTGFDVKLRR